MELLKDSVCRNVTDLIFWYVHSAVENEVRDAVNQTVYYEIYAEIRDELYIATSAQLFCNTFNHVKDIINSYDT
jgi:hypothetical protein